MEGREALLFDLKNLGAFLVLLEADAGYENVILAACGLAPKAGISPRDQVAQIASFRGDCEVPASRSLLVVYISDPLDPDTMVKVETPELPSALGSDARWLGIRLETTKDDLPDPTLHNTLPWLKADRPAGTPPFVVKADPRPLQIDRPDFIRGGL